MGRGTPKNGFRMTAKRRRLIESGQIDPTAPMARMDSSVPSVFEPRINFTPVKEETEAEIRDRISTRFEIMEEMVVAAAGGGLRSLIISGPAGVGKSYEAEKALKESCDQYEFIKGFTKATGLYKLLWKHREEGSVLVFDDCDAVFHDETSLNFLKAVCDTGKNRTVSYRSEYQMEDEDGEIIPGSFEFAGTVVFLTNLDFDLLISKGHKLTPHLEALESRSHYIDLSMRSKRDYLVRIAMVVEAGMLRGEGLNDEQAAEVMEFIHDNQDRLRELSLRMVVKIAGLVKSRSNWKRVAEITCLRNQ